MDLSGYVLAQLHQDSEFMLCRGQCTDRGQTSGLPSVLVAMTASAHPAPDSIRMLEHELALAAEVDSAWAARPLALTQYQGRAALILEDKPGEPLEQLLKREPVNHALDGRHSAGPTMTLETFLRLAIALSAALGEVHRRSLIHKDIKPSNILVNAETSQVWLTGFGIASRLPRERRTPDPPETIAGTLAYMAPEQTGRMNRSIDCRSDLYALGVTLYQMLTGSLPFTATNPIEWVHCHIARLPIAPSERVANVPAPVSAIIMKLLAKNAEERYQTAAGLQRDLQHCLAHWEPKRRIDDFPLGDRDTADRLLIPEKLYGRECEVQTLLTAFDRAVSGEGPALVLVSGYSGIGKSSVVNELQPVLVPPHGLLATGKFDRFKREIPYSTLAEAFQRLVRSLLATSDVELGRWRDALREALGPNGQLIVDLVPELKLVIGEQAPVPELPPQDAQRRFQLVFRRFLAVFARPEHPLAVFLDDLQWLDAATLALLEHLLTQADVRHLLLIGAYRENEVTPTHPLTFTLAAIRKAGARVHEIVLAPLTMEDTSQLIADSLRTEAGLVAPLAELVHEKTAGNPFFVIQFLTALADEGLLVFDHATAHWSWNLPRIRAKGYTDNVADLMIGKLRRLPERTQDILRRLACLGSSADVALLEMVYEDSTEGLRRDLLEALRTELVLVSQKSYRFLHDRVQEAAYALIPEADRAEAHLRIGRLLIARTPRDKWEEAIFEIVNQLNRGAGLITSQDEREQLAELNLTAGRRAKAASAYVSALRYLEAGTALLSDGGWDHRPDVVFALELQRAECEFLTGDLAAAEARLAMLSSRAHSPGDRAAVTCLRSDLYMTLNRSDRAVDITLAYLRSLGTDWSPHPTEQDARREYEQTWALLGSRDISELIDLPTMSNADSVATLDVLMKCVSPACFTDENLLSLILWRMVNISLEHGNTDASCYAYTQLAVSAGPRFRNYEAGFQFGRLGYDLVERRGLIKFRPRALLGFSVFTLTWTHHLRIARDMIRQTIDAANAAGDLTYASFSWHNLIGNLLAAGEPLDDVQREAERGLAFVQKIGFGLEVDIVGTQLAFIRTLRGSTATFGSFNSTEFDEMDVESRLSSEPGLAFVACWYWTRKLQARFFAGDYAGAVDASLNAQRLLWTSPAFIETAEAHFYGALAHAASCDSAASVNSGESVEALRAHHKQLLVWAEHCPENFENRALLVSAEVARIEGRELDAERLYEAAIRSAHGSGFVHHEALANELAARFYAARGFATIAEAYLQNARYGYLRWGADQKVRQLDELHPQFRGEETSAAQTGTIEAPLEQLDLATVLKVSQAVSGETVLDTLLHTVMRTAMEHAGAERALLILPRGTEQRIVAEAVTSGEVAAVRLRDAPVSGSELPETILRYTLHTRESVILDDASRLNSFSADPYIGERRARSLLCLPLTNQANLIGVLYLENNLAPHVFAPARIAVLKLLASQAATSLDNARLFDDVKQAEAAVAASERNLKLTIDTIPALAWSARPDGSAEFFNQHYLDYTGLTSEQASGWGWTMAVHPEDLDGLATAWQRIMASQATGEAEARLRRHDSCYRWFLFRANPLRDEAGTITKWYGINTDIEERKRAEAELGALKDQLYKENLVLRDEVDRTSMFEEIVGTSAALRPVLDRVAKVARTDSTVLITGETGTGKELVARAVHRRSARASRAFVSVNCAAIPRELIASELFGHEKGAFTGATQRRLGRFELAHGGTLFLDEVGELPMETQVALLRVLQERAFERVGGTASVRIDVRVLTATNRDLQAAIEAGKFRSDLFYRLNVFPIAVPALRERADDIPLLVEYFIDRYARSAGKTIRRVNKRTLDQLRSYPWPGNVRELQNVIERSVIVCETDEFTVDGSWLSTAPVGDNHALSVTLAGHEKTIIEDALRASGGRVFGPSGAAARLAIPRSTLESRIRTLGIDKNRFRPRRPRP